MPFDQKTRNLLQRTVTACRLILSEEFGKQLRETYGISDDGTVASWEALSHLSDEDTQTSRLLRDRLDHLATGLTSQGKSLASARQESVKRIIREQAFTVLNRLAALRMAEERKIVLECVSRGHQSDGFCLFQQNTHGALGEIEESYRAYLFVLFDFLSIDLGVLFNRWDLAGLLFPRKEALDNVLKELQGKSATKADEISPAQFSAIWAEDETIGWIYQYYNCPIERKKMREESAAPRNTRELAVRNQFFTPRYVVEFLTDNTLGRIWYEMTHGDTTLKEQCRYLVRRPTEIFLQPGDTAPLDGEAKPDNLSQEELLKQPVHIPHRPLKDPRTILMLDPACGSMHFGLYAFDLFEVIYDEAWEMAERIKGEGRSIQELEAAYPQFSSFILHTSSFQSKESFLRQVPRLIIEHNLHGIDIDPRCAQIAGLSLWLRAQKAWQRLGLQPAERPAIKRSNIVCAEPMPGEKELLREFVEREFPAAERAVCLRLLEAIFDKMQLAGEAGSLLKIEEEIRSAIEDARDAWQKLATKPPELFTTTELNQLSTAPELTGLEQAVSSLTTDPRHLTTDFWERIEERIYAALRDYAEQAENGGGFQRRLFAEDAARGFAFIDVCRKRYDVALMNPPFGAPTIPTAVLVEGAYTECRNDVYGAFILRAYSLLANGGTAGAITNRTGFFTAGYENWRAKLVYSPASSIRVFADLGSGVLDSALVETAAYCCDRVQRRSADAFSVIGIENKAGAMLAAVGDLVCGRPSERFRTVCFADLNPLPSRPFAYWVPSEISNLFTIPKKLEPAILEARQGLRTLDNFRFLRLWWEVKQDSAFGSSWVFHLKGGPFQKFFSNPHLLCAWKNAGAEIKALVEAKYGSVSRIIQAQDFYFRFGLTFTRRTSSRLGVRAAPAGCNFGDKGPLIVSRLDSREDLYFLLSFLNCPFVAYLISLSLAAAEGAARSYEVGIIQRLPLLSFEQADRKLLAG
ncbi:MAG: BREX-1 system adenine-specific DNA-methyltransferase PglX, partial [Verrucomicrobiales bacterium]